MAGGWLYAICIALFAGIFVALATAAAIRLSVPSFDPTELSWVLLVPAVFFGLLVAGAMLWRYRDGETEISLSERLNEILRRDWGPL
jgi:hypothetical protein